MESDELVRRAVRVLDARSAGIVVVELPGRERPVLACAGLDLDDARGPEVGPVELLLAGPDQLDGPAGPAGQAGGLECGLARVLAAVAGPGVGHDDPHAVLGHPERRGQLAAHAERPLRAGPHGQLAVLPLGHRRAGLERGMRDVGDRVRLLGAGVRGLQSLGDRPGIRARPSPAAATAAPAAASGRLLAVRPLQIPEQVLVRDRRPGLPFGLDRRQGPRGLMFAGRDHAHEVAVADDDHLGHRLRGGQVDRGQRPVVRRGAQHLPVPHAREADVRGVLVRAGDERPAVDLRRRMAGDGPLVRRRGRRLFGHGLRELAALSELAVGERLVGPRADDRPVCGGQFAMISLQGLGREVEERLARRRRPGAGVATCPAWSGCRTCPCRTGSTACRP